MHERLGGAARSREAEEQTRGVQVLIEVGPVDAVAGAGDAPVGALLRSCVEETRLPDQGDGDLATVP